MKPSPAVPVPKRRIARLGAIGLAALLAACSFVPPYERPPAPVASAWPAGTDAGLPQAGDARAAADLPWQEFVQDDALRELVGLALEGNRDLRIAVHNIELARAQYQIRRADQFPTVAGALNGTRTAPNPAAATASAGQHVPSISSVYTVGLGVSAWELDFFGRIAALKDAALASYLATEEARKSAQISLIASVAGTWLQLKTDTTLLALAERTLATRQQTLELTRLRFDHGAASALDLQQAQSLVATAAAARAQQQRLRAQDINLLTLLAGQPVPPRLIPQVPAAAVAAEGTDDAAAELPRFAPVPAGLPSDLLLRRPDIRAAEQQLIAANANIGAARASFFPRITLTGSIGRASTSLEGLFGGGGVGAWTFGPSITLPIFDAGRNQAALEAARAAREVALTQYEKAIQTAFREVADALASRAALDEQYRALQAQAQADRERFRLSELRWRSGLASSLDLLDAQRSLFATEQALAQAGLAQRVADVQLYKALGGGWIEAGAAQPAG